MRVDKKHHHNHHRQTSLSVLSRIIFFLPLSILVIERVVMICFYPKVVDEPSGAAAAVVTSYSSLAAVSPMSREVLVSASASASASALSSRILLLSLPELTQFRADEKCPANLTLIADVVSYSSTSSTGTGTGTGTGTAASRKIPRIIHQTSRSRCMTQRFAQTMQSWQHFDGWSYFLHDDNAIQRLFSQENDNFPLLKVVTQHCLLHGTLMADLWRYLVLWRHGGIYVDLDTIPSPSKFHPETSISPMDEAFFVVEQYHMLSQYFMAVAPQHPLMWYAIHDALLNLFKADDTGAVRAAFATGPHALHHAYMNFRHDGGQVIDPAGTGYKPVWKGTFIGTNNWTVTVVGIGENQNEYIQRDVLGARFKLKGYKRMEMSHFQQDEKDQSGISCIRSIRRAGEHNNNTGSPPPPP
jgi:Glycosyltransferase sugar-binding region containing DXD motif